MTDIKEKIKALINEAQKRASQFNKDGAEYVNRENPIYQAQMQQSWAYARECAYWADRLTELYNDIKEGENG